MGFDDTAIAAFTTLIVVLDPIGMAPIFLSVTLGMTSRQRRQTALWAVALACLILVFFALLGDLLLGYLGISLSAFRIAGGLMLFYTGFEMVFGSRRSRSLPGDDQGASEVIDVRSTAAFPLAIPLMAGPGAITACILLAGTVRGALGGQAMLIGVILATCLITLACLLAAEPLDRLIGQTGKIVLTRLLGVLLAALAVQFVADGAIAIARG